MRQSNIAENPVTNWVFRISDDILYPINEILRARQGNSTSFQPLLVKDIIYELDDEDGDVCSRVGVPVFNALLRLFLQTTNCPEVERGLYLLAVSIVTNPSTTTALKLAGHLVPRCAFIRFAATGARNRIRKVRHRQRHPAAAPGVLHYSEQLRRASKMGK